MDNVHEIPTAPSVELYWVEGKSSDCFYTFAVTQSGFYRLAVWRDENIGNWRFGWHDLLEVNESVTDHIGCDTMRQAMSILRAKFMSRFGHFVCVPLWKLREVLY